MKTTLLILAAGMGSRFGGLKQLHGFGPGGHSILEYSVYDAIRAGFDQVVIVIRRDFESEFRTRFIDRFAGRVEVKLAFQEMHDVPGDGKALAAQRTKPWGTAHAIHAARSCIDGPFAVINADDFYGREAFQTARKWLSSRTASCPSELCLVAYRLDRTLSEHGTVSRGVCESDGDGRLVSVTEYRRLRRDGDGVVDEETAARFSPETDVSMNLFGLSAAFFGDLETGLDRFIRERGQDKSAEYYLPSFVAGLVSAGRATVQVLRTGESWMGMTHREDEREVAERLAALIRAGVYPEYLWA